jgi:hypothetical protein
METIISKSCVENNLLPKEELLFRKKIKLIFLESSKETIIELMGHDKYKLVLSSMLIYLIQQKDEKKEYINSNININGVSLPINIEYKDLNKFIHDLSFC